MTADQLNALFLTAHPPNPSSPAVPAVVAVSPPAPTPGLPVNVLSMLTPNAITKPVVVPTWSLRSGTFIGTDLKAWGQRAGWTVLWQSKQDWSVPANAQFEGTFQSAAGDVVAALASEGANVRAKFFDGNNTLIIFQPGDSNAP